MEEIHRNKRVLKTIQIKNIVVKEVHNNKKTKKEIPRKKRALKGQHYYSHKGSKRQRENKV